MISSQTVVPHLTDVVAAGGSDGLVDHLLTHDAVECLLDTTQQTSLRETKCSVYTTVQYNTMTLYIPSRIQTKCTQQINGFDHIVKCTNSLKICYNVKCLSFTGIVVDMGTAGQVFVQWLCMGNGNGNNHSDCLYNDLTCF